MQQLCKQRSWNVTKTEAYPTCSRLLFELWLIMSASMSDYFLAWNICTSRFFYRKIYRTNQFDSGQLMHAWKRWQNVCFQLSYLLCNRHGSKHISSKLQVKERIHKLILIRISLFYQIPRICWIFLKVLEKLYCYFLSRLARMFFCVVFRQI